MLTRLAHRLNLAPDVNVKKKKRSAKVHSFSGPAADRSRVLRSWRAIVNAPYKLSEKILFVAIDSFTKNGKTAPIPEEELIRRVGTVEQILLSKGEVSRAQIQQERLRHAREDVRPLVGEFRLGLFDDDPDEDLKLMTPAAARAVGEHILRRAWELVGRNFADERFLTRLVQTTQLLFLGVAGPTETEDEATALGDSLTTALCTWLEDKGAEVLSPTDHADFLALAADIHPSTA